jgi:hypothetical protein
METDSAKTVEKTYQHLFLKEMSEYFCNENHYNPVRAKSYGGFWKRLVACIIDGLIIGVVNGLSQPLWDWG